MVIQLFQNTTISTIVEVVFVSLRTASTDRLLTLYNWNRFSTERRFF